MVTGYSTSHQPFDAPWPSIFQDMLNQHAGNDTTYFVFRHTVGGTPIAKWTDICGDGHHVQDALNNYVNPGSLVPEGTPRATIMLAQQSLQWAFNNCDDRFLGIEGPEDEGKIQLGMDAIIYYMRQFFESGIQDIYMATHIYKTGDYPLNLDGEKYALQRALDSLDSFYPGPELFEISKSLFPDGFAADQQHPGPELANAIALYWYLVIAGENAKDEIMQPIADAAGIEIPEKEIPMENIVAYWSFDEASGSTFDDLYGNQLHGEFSGDPLWVEGKKNGAISLDGTDDFGRIWGKDSSAVPNEITILDKGTISFWFKYQDIYNDGGVTLPQSLPILYFGQEDDQTGQNGLEIYIGHNDLESKQRIYITIHKGGIVQLCFDNAFDLVEGEWYHFAVVVDSSDHRGYLNGVEYERHYNAGTNINDHAFFHTVEEAYQDILTIGYGRFSSKSFWHFNGALDEMYLFDKVLSAEEIEALFNQGTITAIESTDITTVPDGFSLSQNYPNPFNPSTTIRFSIPQKNYVTLTVFNIAGQKVATLINEEKHTGVYRVTFDAGNMASGVYYYLLTAGKNKLMRKAILIK